MNPLLSLPKLIARLLCLVVAWNTFGSVSLSDPLSESTLSDIFQDRYAVEADGFWYTPVENPQRHHTVFEEFISEEENQKDENEHHLSSGMFHQVSSLSPFARVAFIRTVDFQILSRQTLGLYIRYCSLKIPFPLL